MTQLVCPSVHSSAALTQPSNGQPVWHAEFLRMLPKIENQAQFQFQHLKGDTKDEAVQEAIANACQAYARLSERGVAESATWSSLANFAVKQVKTGRQVGGELNIKEISSRRCQRKNGFGIRSLSHWDDQDQTWTDMVVEDRHATPADVAAFRIDFRAFLRLLSHRNRKLTLQLAQGHGTKQVAQRFRLTPGRISQLRRELCERWHQFHAEPAAASGRNGNSRS